MEFNYTAKDKNSKVIKGIIEASSLNNATGSLREKGLFVTNIKEVGKKAFGIKFLEKKVSIKDKIIFTEQLGVMVASGISIVDALEALKEESTNKIFGAQIQKIISDIQGGSTLSKALAKYPESFSEIYINMVQSGEESGKLEMVLNRLAKQLEKDYELGRKIRGALAYPIFVLVALVIVVGLIMAFVIPQLKLVFDEAEVKLPLLTRIMISVSYFVKDFGIFLIIFAVGAIIGISRYRKTPTGKKIFDNTILKIPVFGLLLKKSYMARFTRTFASLTASGLPLIDVFTVSGQTIGNSIYKDEIYKMASEVKSGKQMSVTFKNSLIMPKMIGQLATVGEKSGNIDEVFNTLADFFDRDVDSITANLSVMLEPILMAIMGVGIGLVIIAVLQPIYGLVNAI